MGAAGRRPQKKVEDFALMATHIHTVAIGFTYMANNLLRQPVVTLVFGKNERQSLQDLFDSLFQTAIFSEFWPQGTVLDNKKPSTHYVRRLNPKKPNENNLPYSDTQLNWAIF